MFAARPIAGPGGKGCGETSLFLTFSGASALLVSAWIVNNYTDADSRVSAQAFYWISVALSLSAFVWTTSDVLGWLPVITASNWWFRILTYRAWLVVGTAVSCAVLSILASCFGARLIVANDAARAFLSSSYVLKGILVSVSMSLFSVEIGKLAHDTDMRQFFLQSGYPVWFLYFTMLAETLAAVGLLFRRTTVSSALCLSVIMNRCHRYS